MLGRNENLKNMSPVLLALTVIKYFFFGGGGAGQGT